MPPRAHSSSRSVGGRDTPADAPRVRVLDLGRMAYGAAYDVQSRVRDQLLAARDGLPGPIVAHLLLVEHDPPVITVTRRPGAADHLLATREVLRAEGIDVAETDRGGDVTYHGPGQLVAYPIVDLNRLNLGLVDYLRMLEDIVIEVCIGFGLPARRDPGATGVWVGEGGGAKVCAMGVRVRRWVTTHGLALNVRTNLEHFDLIVPCGLAGRTVTSLARELGDACPAMPVVKASLADAFERAVGERLGRAERTIA